MTTATTTKQYWHELTDEQRKEVFASKPLVGEFMEKYAQPEWCNYPEALAGTMGCWSLIMGDNNPVNKKFCAKCECCSHYDGVSDEQVLSA